MSSTKTHYGVLNLKQTHSLTSEDVKVAYRNALLAHHPDRLNVASSSTHGPTIDQITAAYHTLSDPKLRTDYDRALGYDKTGRLGTKAQSIAHQGIELYDLEDLNHNPCVGTWSKDCRCGSEMGFIVTERELEEADEQQSGDTDRQREILVTCQGCSLIIRVTFAVEPG